MPIPSCPSCKGKVFEVRGRWKGVITVVIDIPEELYIEKLAPKEGVEVTIIIVNSAFYSIALILEPYVPSELGTAHDLLKSCILIVGMLLTAIMVVLIVRTSSKIIAQWAMEQ